MVGKFCLATDKRRPLYKHTVLHWEPLEVVTFSIQKKTHQCWPFGGVINTTADKLQTTYLK